MELFPGDIIIKDAEVLRGFIERRFDPLLINIISDISKNHGIRITESYRSKKDMHDLHGTQPVRAVDADLFGYGSEKIGFELVNWINSRWAYDPHSTNKSTVASVRNNGGLHIHIQTCQQTRSK